MNELRVKHTTCAKLLFFFFLNIAKLNSNIHSTFGRQGNVLLVLKCRLPTALHTVLTINQTSPIFFFPDRLPDRQLTVSKIYILLNICHSQNTPISLTP
jgi:hypothetical protein